jgi:hypothetical protein
MSKKMPLRERITIILDIASKLEHDYPNTAKWVRNLAQTIAIPKKSIDEITYALKEILENFRVEYIGSDVNSNYREKCLQAYINLFGTMLIDKGTQASYDTFESLIAAFETRQQTLTNIAEVYQTLLNSKGLTEKRRYIGFCIMYSFYVEGYYDEVIRELYLFKKTIEDKKVDYEAIRDMKIFDMQKELDPVFFEGYNNHLRNSIAHARFSYKEDSKKILFKDRDERIRRDSYEESFTFEEFMKNYYGKIDDFCRLDNRFMVLLSLRDIVIQPTPFH